MKKEERSRRHRLRRALLIKPGDIYEDCTYHPCVCLAAQQILYHGWRGRLRLVCDVDLTGVSLWDLSVRSCSAWHCAVVPLKPMELLRSLYYHAEDKAMLERGGFEGKHSADERWYAGSGIHSLRRYRGS